MRISVLHHLGIINNKRSGVGTHHVLLLFQVIHRSTHQHAMPSPRKMRKIKRKRIPHDDETIPQVAKRLDVGNLVETEVDELFVVVRDAVSAFHHHVGLLEAIGPTGDIQIQRFALPHMRADPIASHVILGVKTGGKTRRD